MPRVTADHGERRRRQIIQSAQRCFARKGLYETSMQDLFEESGLSAGAVYHYFKSKEDLVRTISIEVSDQLARVMEEINKDDAVPSLPGSVGRLARAIEDLGGPGGPARVALSAWAAAMHDPGIATTTQDVLVRIRSGWVELARKMRDAGQLSGDADIEAAGVALFGLLPGFLLQYLVLGDVDADILERGVRELFGMGSGRREKSRAIPDQG